MSQEHIASSQQDVLRTFEEEQIRQDLPKVQTGDTVRLQVKVVEGVRERLQPFEGVVIRMRGTGINRNFTVRHIFQNIGVERTFLFSSPRIDSIKVLRHAKVHRKQLYYLRERTGKSARLQEVRLTADEVAANGVKKSIPATPVEVAITETSE